MDTELMAEKNRAYYEANKERLRASALERYHANKEAKQAYMKEYQKTYKRPPMSAEKREEFNRARRERYATDPEFRARYKELAKSWAKASPERKRQSRMRSNYGLEPGQYEEMLAAQNGGCAICGTAVTGVREKGRRERRLSVDHNHSTGAVRGLLCHHCNFGIGHFKDSPELLQKAMAYLINSSSGAT